MQGRHLPPALIDTTGDQHQNIAIDQNDLSHLDARIPEIMQYWQQALALWPLGAQRLQQIVDLVCPQVDYTPPWNHRIKEDTGQWLVLPPPNNHSI